MEKELKNFLHTALLKPDGHVAGGAINDGEIYATDTGKVFVKKNSNLKARQMFDGEFASLKSINATNTIKVPTPFLVVDNPSGGAALAMEYLEIKELYQKANILGDQLARFHLHNIELQKIEKIRQQTIGSPDIPDAIYKFGFHMKTFWGYAVQENTWDNDWPTFYTHKLNDQITMIEKEYGDRETIQLWSSLSRSLPTFFTELDVKPSLLHGDLWAGNVGELENEPVVFDPASFYGHHEYDLALAGLYGGFCKPFWDSYHKVIPRTDNWGRRQELYRLSLHLNHWYHFGSEYRSLTLGTMRKLINWATR